MSSFWSQVAGNATAVTPSADRFAVSVLLPGATGTFTVITAAGPTVTVTGSAGAPIPLRVVACTAASDGTGLVRLHD